MKDRIRIGVRAACLVGAAMFAEPAAAGEPYRVAPGDVLQVAIYGDSKLSGRFKVGPDGTIGFPLLGAFPVAGSSTGDIMRRLETALAERIPSGAPAAVEVAEHAPVYILGEVDKPGPVPFTPEMTVLELVASAGGLRRPREGDAVLLPLIAAEHELADLRLAWFSGRVQRARLAAELEDKPFSAADVVIDPLVASESMRRVVLGEADLFDKRRALLLGQEAALRAQRDSYDPEIESLRASIALYEEEVRLLARDGETQDALLKKGLTVESRVLAARREQASLQRSVLEARSFLARAIQRKLEVEQRLEELRQVRRRDDAAALRDLDASQVRIERRILSAAATLDEMRQKGPGVVEQRATTVSYTLVRRGDGGRTSVQVDEAAEIRPGDVLRVERRTAVQSAAASDGASRVE